MWKVSESDEDSIFAARLPACAPRMRSPQCLFVHSVRTTEGLVSALSLSLSLSLVSLSLSSRSESVTREREFDTAACCSVS